MPGDTASTKPEAWRGRCLAAAFGLGAYLALEGLKALTGQGFALFAAGVLFVLCVAMPFVSGPDKGDDAAR